MPLVDPVTMGSGKSAAQEWLAKLAGKKIGDSSDNITFAKKELPSKHRVLSPDSMKTMDHDPERLNIHVDEQGLVKDVTHG